MGNEIYEDRPARIVARAQQMLKPLGFTFGYSNRGILFSIKKGNKSKPYPHFYKNKKGRIFMRFTCNGNTFNECIDYKTDEWLAYYIYKQLQ